MKRFYRDYSTHGNVILYWHSDRSSLRRVIAAQDTANSYYWGADSKVEPEDISRIFYAIMEGEIDSFLWVFDRFPTVDEARNAERDEQPK